MIGPDGMSMERAGEYNACGDAGNEYNISNIFIDIEILLSLYKEGDSEGVKQCLADLSKKIGNDKQSVYSELYEMMECD